MVSDYVHERLPKARFQPEWIDDVDGIAERVPIEVRLGNGQPYRIFADKAALLWVVPAGAVVDESGAGVAFAAGEAVACELAISALTVGFVLETLDDVTARARKRDGAAKMIVHEVERAACARLPKLFINAEAVEVINNGAVARAVEHYVVAVV